MGRAKTEHVTHAPKDEDGPAVRWSQRQHETPVQSAKHRNDQKPNGSSGGITVIQPTKGGGGEEAGVRQGESMRQPMAQGVDRNAIAATGHEKSPVRQPTNPHDHPQDGR